MLNLLADTVEQFLPIAPKIQDNGDLSFYVMSEDDAQAVSYMNKKIADKMSPSLKYRIYSKRVPAPFELISFANRLIIEVRYFGFN